MVAAISLIFYFIALVSGVLMMLGAHSVPVEAGFETAVRATVPQLGVLCTMFVVTQALGVAVLRIGRNWQAYTVLTLGLLLILSCVADVIYITLQGVGENNVIPLIVSAFVFAVQTTCLVTGVAAREAKKAAAAKMVNS